MSWCCVWVSRVVSWWREPPCVWVSPTEICKPRFAEMVSFENGGFRAHLVQSECVLVARATVLCLVSAHPRQHSSLYENCASSQNWLRAARDMQFFSTTRLNYASSTCAIATPIEHFLALVFQKTVSSAMGGVPTNVSMGMSGWVRCVESLQVHVK